MNTISITLVFFFLFVYNYQAVSAAPEQMVTLVDFRNESKVLNSSFTVILSILNPDGLMG